MGSPVQGEEQLSWMVSTWITVLVGEANRTPGAAPGEAVLQDWFSQYGASMPFRCSSYVAAPYTMEHRAVWLLWVGGLGLLLLQQRLLGVDSGSPIKLVPCLPHPCHSTDVAAGCLSSIVPLGAPAESVAQHHISQKLPVSHKQVCAQDPAFVHRNCHFYAQNSQLCIQIT